MTIEFPRDLPYGLAGVAQRVQLRPRHIVGRSRSAFSGQSQAQLWGDFWEMDVSLKPMRWSDAAAWLAFLISLRGPYGSFIAGHPAYGGPRGIATGTPVVAGAAQAGSVLTTDGWTSSQTGILLAGDLIQLGTGASAHLHMNLTDADSNGSGEATLDLWPNLRAAPGDGSGITLNDPVGHWSLDQVSLPADFDPGGFDADEQAQPLVYLNFTAIERY